MKKRTRRDLITEWLRDEETSLSSLANYTEVTNAAWLKLERARLARRGVRTKIVVHPENAALHALAHVTLEGARHG